MMAILKKDLKIEALLAPKAGPNL